MQKFRPVVEDFATTMDALRDFVTSVGPVLTQRRAEVSESSGKVLGPFGVAALLAGEDLGALEISNQMKEAIADIRKVIVGAEPNLSAENIAQIQNAFQ